MNKTIRPRVGADVEPAFKRELMIIAATEVRSINELVIEALIAKYPSLAEFHPMREETTDPVAETK